jgi:hypothetical protein
MSGTDTLQYGHPYWIQGIVEFREGLAGRRTQLCGVVVSVLGAIIVKDVLRLTLVDH